jgi:hypothetical protein
VADSIESGKIIWYRSAENIDQLSGYTICYYKDAIRGNYFFLSQILQADQRNVKLNISSTYDKH